MPKLEEIVQQLEETGYRNTASRREVIAAVLSQRGHFAIDDICQQVRWAGRATVFRTMKLLQDTSVVCRVLLENGNLHYRLSSIGHHHHLVCVECGGVQDMEDCVVAEMLTRLANQTSYAIEGHWLEFYGRCGDCRVAKPELQAV